FDKVLEPDRALDLGQHRTGIGIPFGDPLTALDLVTLLDAQARTVLDAMDRTLGAILVDHDHRHVARHDDGFAIGILGDVFVLDLDLAVEVRLDERLLGDLSRATDVERPHGKLRARLADRLRGNDADRLAHVDRCSTGEIAPVALSAHAIGRFAGEHRADAHLLNARLGDRLDLRLFQQRPALDDSLVARGIAQVLRRRATENAARKRRHDLAGVDDRAHLDAALGAAVFAGDDAVLR